MPRSLEDFAVFAAPAVFVLLWASGFIGAKLGLGYAEPLTFLALRMITVVVLLAIVIAATRPKWPHANGLMHSAATGLMVHGLYLGGVFVAIENGLSAGLVALIVSLQPVLTSTVANRWLGERVVARQWLGLVARARRRLSGAAGQDRNRRGDAACLDRRDRGARRHHRRHALSKALRRRHRLAAGSVHPICGGGTVVLARRIRVRNARRAFYAAIFVRARLARARAVARRGLASVFSHPPRGGDPRRQSLLSHAAGDGFDGLGIVRRAAHSAVASRHGGLRRRRVFGELAAART